MTERREEERIFNLSVATYNIHSGVGSDGQYSLGRIANVLNEINADLVCLQECEVNHVKQKTRLWSRPHDDDQPHRIARLCGGGLYPHVAFAPAVRSVVAHSYLYSESFGEELDGEFGIAILSKWPIVDQKVLNFARYGKKTPRNALACQIERPFVDDSPTTTTTTTKIWLVCTHLGCHFWGGEQLQQSRELRAFINGLGATTPPADDVVILGADLNCLRWFAAISVLETVLENADDCEDSDGKGTFPSIGRLFAGLMKLDYIYYYSSSNVITCTKNFCSLGARRGWPPVIIDQLWRS